MCSILNSCEAMDSNLDKWIEKLRQKISLEEDELVKLCHIVKDILIQESNVVVCCLNTGIIVLAHFHSGNGLWRYSWAILRFNETFSYRR